MIAVVPATSRAACPDFSAPITFTIGAATNPSSLAAGDFNGDGKLDLAVALPTTNQVAILSGNGDGTFTSSQTLSSLGAGPVAVAVGDFTGDGKPDVAVLNAISNTVAILFNDGSGSFTTSTLLATLQAGPTVLIAGDLNGDGFDDLVSVSPNNVFATLFINNPSHTFSTSFVPIPAGVVVAQLATGGKVDGDSNLDLVVVSNGGPAATLLGDGAGAFTASPTFTPGAASPASAGLGDFDGDGKLDLVVLDQALLAQVHILLGDGTGNFANTATLYTAGVNPAGVVVRDFNGDGKLDLAVLDGDHVHLLLGNGDGSFAAAIPYPVPVFSSPTRSLIAGDFNGDGTSDLALADSDGAAVLLNVSTCATISTIVLNAGPAAGGQTVVINGANLAGAASVTFGGTPATITANSAASITVTTPPHASGAVAVVVTTAGGSVTLPAGYVYTIPVPALSEGMLVALAAALAGIAAWRSRA